MEEYKSNSHKSRERAKAELPEKKVEKIVSGSVKTTASNVSYLWELINLYVLQMPNPVL